MVAKKDAIHEKRLTLLVVIEKIVERDDCTYLGALTRYAEENKLTINKVAKMMCQKLRMQVEEEVRHSRLVRQETLQKFGVNGRQKK